MRCNCLVSFSSRRLRRRLDVFLCCRDLRSELASEWLLLLLDLSELLVLLLLELWLELLLLELLLRLRLRDIVLFFLSFLDFTHLTCLASIFPVLTGLSSTIVTLCDRLCKAGIISILFIAGFGLFDTFSSSLLLLLSLSFDAALLLLLKSIIFEVNTFVFFFFIASIGLIAAGS